MTEQLIKIESTGKKEVTHLNSGLMHHVLAVYDVLEPYELMLQQLSRLSSHRRGQFRRLKGH